MKEYDPLPSLGFVRLPQILEVYPISKSHWWAGVKAGRLPLLFVLVPVLLFGK